MMENDWVHQIEELVFIHSKDKLCKSKISMKLPANLFSIIGTGSFNSTLKAIIPLTDVYVV